MWIVASDSDRSMERDEPIDAEVAQSSSPGESDVPYSMRLNVRQPERLRRATLQHGDDGPECRGWPSMPNLAGVDDGVAHRMDRIRATGNGQVPAVAALAWETLAP
jgi:DNA (cytosine-5)-methyltransferase 1